MPARAPIHQLIALAVIGLGLVLHGLRAEALEVAATFTIVQQPPVVALNGPAGADYAATFMAEGGPVAMVAATRLTVTDLFVGQLASARVTIINPLDGAQELVAATTIGAISASYAPATGVLTLNGSDSVANYQQVLRSLTYQDRAGNPIMTAREITVTVNDGQQDSVSVHSTVTLVPNDPQPLSDAGPGDPVRHCGLGGGFAVLLGLSMLALLRAIAAASGAGDGRPPATAASRTASGRLGTGERAAPGNARASPAPTVCTSSGVPLLIACLAASSASLTATESAAPLPDAQRATLQRLLDPIIGFGIPAVPGTEFARGDLVVQVTTADGEQIVHLDGLHARRPDGSWLVLLILPLQPRLGITIDASALRPCAGGIGSAMDDEIDALGALIRASASQGGGDGSLGAGAGAGADVRAPFIADLGTLAALIERVRGVPTSGLTGQAASTTPPHDVAPIAQLRLSVGWAPRTRDASISDSQAATGIALQDQVSGLPAGIRVELGYVRTVAFSGSDWGWLAGIALLDSHQRGSAGDPAQRWGVFTGPLSLDVAGADLMLGCSSPTWMGMHVEAGPLVGIGLATIGDAALQVGSSSASTAFSGRGLYEECGLRVSLVATPMRQLVAAVGCTVLASRSSARLRYPGHAGTVDESVRITTVGIAPSASLGWQF